MMMGINHGSEAKECAGLKQGQKFSDGKNNVCKLPTLFVHES
jgi:hypothetical protein